MKRKLSASRTACFFWLAAVGLSTAAHADNCAIANSRAGARAWVSDDGTVYSPGSAGIRYLTPVRDRGVLLNLYVNDCVLEARDDSGDWRVIKLDKEGRIFDAEGSLSQFTLPRVLQDWKLFAEWAGLRAESGAAPPSRREGPGRSHLPGRGAAPQRPPADEPTAPPATPQWNKLSETVRNAFTACAKCHQGNPDVPREYWSASGIVAGLGSISDATMTRMLKKLALAPSLEQEIRSLHRAARSPASSPPTGGKSAATDRCKLMDPRRHALYRGAIPEGQSDDDLLTKLRAGAIPYTRREMPRARQQDIAGTRDKLILSDAASSRRFGLYDDQGGKEFPWNLPGGMDRAQHADSFTFFVPPESGIMADVYSVDRFARKGYTGRSQNLYAPVHAWDYEPGTAFGEVLTMAIGSRMYPFEVRLRVMTDAGWAYRVYKPYADADDLAQTIKSQWPNWQSDPEWARFVTALERQDDVHWVSPSDYLSAHELKQNSEASRVLLDEAPVLRLPKISDEKRKWIMSRPFKDATNRPFFTTTKGNVTKSSWSAGNVIVPDKYFGALIPSTAEGCTKCHDTAGIHVDNTNPRPGLFPASDGIRDWYGYHRGKPPSDKDIVVGNRGKKASIHSWHPFSADSISDRNGYGPTRPRANPVLERCGLLRWRL